MSATWTCICGKTFRVSTYHAKLVTCPLCYFVLGEAVPLRFEPPETFQERAPESRTVLASPEVLVKVAAPIRVAAFDGVDELGEPDIRIKQTRLSRALVMLIGLTVAIMVVVYSSFGRMVSDHRDAAHAQTKVLTRACVAYERRNGEFPETLDKLLAQDPFGVVYLDDPHMLIDPWGRPYQYDAKGQRNVGEQPDIWVVTPDGVEIGNWPMKRN